MCAWIDCTLWREYDGGFGSCGITGTLSAAEVVDLAVSADELG